MAAATNLYSPFQRFVIEVHLQFEKDFAELQKLTPTEVTAVTVRKHEEFLCIFKKFLAMRGEYRVQRDEITFLTEPYQPTLHKYLCQCLSYTPDLVVLTLSYCETDAQREQIESDYKKASIPRRNLREIIANPQGFEETIAQLVPIAPFIIAAKEHFRSDKPEEIELHHKKMALTRKIQERTSTIVLLKLQALYHNLKADQREKTWAARQVTATPAPLRILGLDEEKRGVL